MRTCGGVLNDRKVGEHVCVCVVRRGAGRRRCRCLSRERVEADAGIG